MGKPKVTINITQVMLNDVPMISTLVSYEKLKDEFKIIENQKAFL